MKTTKNINANYSMETGKWTIRNNGEILKEGKGIIEYAEAVKEIKDHSIKFVKENIKW